ncbi:MAG: hypothetical protein AAGN66_19350 [Acidobacteriota bacterium]
MDSMQGSASSMLQATDPMRIDNLSLAFGPAGLDCATCTLTVALHPVDAGNRVTIRYRCGHGEPQVAVAHWRWTDQARSLHVFEARLRVSPGERLEYSIACECPGRRSAAFEALAPHPMSAMDTPGMSAMPMNAMGMNAMGMNAMGVNPAGMDSMGMNAAPMESMGMVAQPMSAMGRIDPSMSTPGPSSPAFFVTAGLILEWLGTAAANGTVGWVTGKILGKIFGGESPDAKAIGEILANQQRIFKELQTILDEIAWATLTLKAFPSQQQILSLYSEFQKVAQADDKLAAERLRTSILSPSDGPITDLSTLDNVIRGGDLVGAGLLSQFITNNLDYLKQNNNSSSLLRIYRSAQTFLDGLFILQFMGLDLLVNALTSKGEFSLAITYVRSTLKNLEAQKKALDGFMPDLMKTIGSGAPFTAVLHNSRANNQVAYGNPPNTNFHGYVWTRDRHPNNGDEEWIFAPDGDTFSIQQVSWKGYCYEDGHHALKCDSTSRQTGWRIIPSSQPGYYLIQRTSNGRRVVAHSAGAGFTCFVNHVDPSDPSAWWHFDVL